MYLVDTFEKLKSYREHDCSNYINYVCSFWLKTMTNVSNNRITMRIKSGNIIENFYATFDKTALNSWQEVRIPIRIPDEILKEITISFNDNNSQHYVKVADMKLYDSGTNQIMIGNDNYNCSLNEISNLIYYSYDDNKEEQEKTLGYSTYITEKDLQMTYLYKYKLSLQPNAELSGYFPLFYNDCTKFVMVNSASFKDGEDNVYSLDFVDDFLEEDKYLPYSRTNYFLQSCSPDGDLRTNQKTYFVQSYNIDGETYNCMIQKTEVDLYDEEVAKHKESYILNCTDFNGKTLLEQDEYDVQNIYKYNEFGDLTSKIITSKSGNTRIEETINYDNNVQTNENDITKTTTYYDDFDNIYKTELLGKNEAESNKLTNEFTYNYFNDSIQKVNNNLNGNNFIKYDSMGRITSISPRKETDSNYYGYKFKYDESGDPVKFSFEYRDEATNKLVENTLVERNKQRTVGETIVNTYLYEEKDNPVCKTNVIDKYGRNFAIVNGEKDVTFKYQNIVESQGAANIMEMYDSEDSEIHYYKYNEDNNLIEYGYGYLDNNNGNSLTEDGYKILDESKGYLNIKKTSEDITELTFQNDNNGCEKIILETSVSKDPEKLLSPRIQFNSGRFKFQPNSDTISYSYDDIGRINVKTMGVHNRWSASNDSSNNSTTLNFIKEIKYCPNSNLIENIKTTNIVLSETKNTIDQIYSYNNKGEIESNNTSFTNGDEKFRKYITNYSYNQASRITSETFKYIDENDNTSTKVFNYTYNDDGSLDSVTENGITKQYYYNKGRLSKVRENNIEYNLTYDNLGNTLTFGSNTYTYVRGNLLSTLNNGNNNFKYYYNGQGKKYKKELPNGEVITYVYDNEKLISEKNSNGKELIYLYDMTGIYGILVNNNGSYLPEGNCYYFEKDILGNVISINDGINEIVHYTYDAFGNCDVINYTDSNIGDINPIRWKSMYCEVESNLYFINNNTYSPELRQTLSMNYLDEIINNSLSVNNLYAYNIYSTNPVALTYDGYTSESTLHLTYEPPQKTKLKKLWDLLWNRWWGKVIAVSLTAISFVVTAVFAPCMLPTFKFTLASVGVTLIVGGVIAGILSAQRGKGFWNGFEDYINENWAQTLAIEMAMYLVSFGVTQALEIGTKCFIEGTLILTSVGLVKIEDIKEGDEVWSYNEETKEKELKKVKRLFRNKTKEWLHLTILNEETKTEEEIICTKNHRIYIKNKGWIEANEILENEEVLLYNNVIGKVIRKELESLTYEETTYNFEVEDNHNYYVCEERVLVHNECQLARNMKKAGKIKEVGEDAHHLFPQEFRKRFLGEIDTLNINIDDANFGIWMKQSLHRKYAKAYNKLWKRVLDAGIVNDNNAMMFAKEFMLEVYNIVI